MSASRTMRSPTAKFMARMSFSDCKAPLTRSLMLSWSVVITPEGATAFCACSAAIKRRRREPVAGQLRGRELDVDAFGLGADQVHLGDVGHLQQPRADILHVVAQLAMREPIRGEAIDDAVGVAEFVIADRRR